MKNSCVLTMIHFVKHSNYNKAPSFVRGEGTHYNKAPWRKKFKIVLQPRDELWKLLFG